MELSPDLGPAAVSNLVKDLHQGDVLHVAKSVRLYSPDAPSYPSELEGTPHDEPVMTMESTLESGLCVIVSQDCDLRRMPDREPYVIIAPLTRVDDERYREATDGLSTRFFAYPELEGSEATQLVVDMRVLSSLEKTAVLSPHIARVPCPLSAPKRERLRDFLGDRFGRSAFPDEIDRQVIKPIEQALKRVRQNAAVAGVFASVAWIGLDWTPGKSYCRLLLLTDPSLRERHQVVDQEVAAVKKRLGKALNHFTRDGDYAVLPNIHDVTEVAAAEVLSTTRSPLRSNNSTSRRVERRARAHGFEDSSTGGRGGRRDQEADRGTRRVDARRDAVAQVLQCPAVARKITQRQLRNESGEVMRGLDAGDSFLVTRNGVAVGELTPVRRHRFVSRDVALAAFSHAPRIDAGRFRADVNRLADQDPAPRG